MHACVLLRQPSLHIDSARVHDPKAVAGLRRFLVGLLMGLNACMMFGWLMKVSFKFMQFPVHCAMQHDSCQSLGQPHFEMTDNLETQVATESQLMEAAAQLAKDKTPERLAAVPGPRTNQSMGLSCFVEDLHGSVPQQSRKLLPATRLPMGRTACRRRLGFLFKSRWVCRMHLLSDRISVVQSLVVCDGFVRVPISIRGCVWGP